MYDYDKFISTYVVKYQPTVYWARFTAPDDNDVWRITRSGPITQDGVIELLNQDAQGNIQLIDIRADKG